MLDETGFLRRLVADNEIELREIKTEIAVLEAGGEPVDGVVTDELWKARRLRALRSVAETLNDSLPRDRARLALL